MNLGASNSNRTHVDVGTDINAGKQCTGFMVATDCRRDGIEGHEGAECKEG